MVIGPFIFQEDLPLYGNNEQKLFQVPARENLQFKIDLFLLRFLISNDRSKLSSSFSFHAYGITTGGNLESRFTNDRLILLIKKNINLGTKQRKTYLIGAFYAE